MQATFHLGHQEVECHERDFPKYEEMTEATAEKNSAKKSLKLSNPGVIASSLHSILNGKMVSEKFDKRKENLSGGVLVNSCQKDKGANLQQYADDEKMRCTDFFHQMLDQVQKTCS